VVDLLIWRNPVRAIGCHIAVDGSKEVRMSEFKPKKDDQRAGDIAQAARRAAGDSPKPHGDKLQHAVDEAAEPAKQKK
jgi:hypothetical protein